MSGVATTTGAVIPLSTDDLGWFFADEHVALAARLRAAADEIAAAEQTPDVALSANPAAGTEAAREAMRDRAAVQALAAHGLF